MTVLTNPPCTLNAPQSAARSKERRLKHQNDLEGKANSVKSDLANLQHKVQAMTGECDQLSLTHVSLDQEVSGLVIASSCGAWCVLAAHSLTFWRG